MLTEFVLKYVILVSIAKLTASFEADLTPEIAAGTEECFYQAVKREMQIDIEYQVLDGGNLEINFYVQDPNGLILLSEVDKTDGSHKVDAKVLGDYKFCFDNRHNHFTQVTAFLEVTSDDAGSEDDDDDEDWKAAKEELGTLVDMTIEDFKKMMGLMKINLEKSSQIQHILKNYEARDRNIGEANFLRVNWFSGIQLFLMISVGLIQVLLIRNLFEDKSRVSTIMKART